MPWFTIRAQFVGLLLVAGLVFGIERLIVTDAEAIENLARDVGVAIEAQRFEALEDFLHEEFTYRGRDRAETIEFVRGLVRKYKPMGVQIVVYEVEVEGDDARAKGVVSGTAYGRPARVPVDATFRRTEDGWRLLEVRGGEYVR